MLATFALIASLWVAEPDEVRLHQWLEKQGFEDIQIKRENVDSKHNKEGMRQYVVKGTQCRECNEVKIFRIFSFWKVYMIDISELKDTKADPFKK